MYLGYLGIDQYGQTYKLKTEHPRKELLEKLGALSASKMYVDTKGGVQKHSGYVINRLWITLYEVHEFKGGK